MCGRFTVSQPERILKFFFNETPEGRELKASFNVAPSHMLATVRQGDRGLEYLSWGLIPSWAKDRKIAFSLINARLETAAEKPAFRKAFAARRCGIFADGFYEWKPVGKIKQPYYFSRPNHDPFAFAGLWEAWKDPETGEVIESCTILTRDAHADVQDIHHRMPVLLPDREALKAWIEKGDLPKQDVALTSFAVGTRVNSARFDDPECIQPLPVALES